MRKKSLIGVALLAVLVAAAVVLRPARKPDIILISIDSLRPDHLGCYGHTRDTSPTIDRLAKEGVLFKNAVSTTSWTLPAHAAMLSGLYDSTHGAYDNGRSLCPSVTLLPEVLKAAGYRTVGFFGGPYLHPAFGFDQGWDAYVDCMTPLPGGNTPAAVVASASRRDSPSHEDVTGPRTRDAFVQWLDKTDDRPFFAFIHLWDVHYDYIPPQKYVDMFDPGYDGPMTGRDLINDKKVNAEMPKRDLDHLIARYDGEIRFTDDVIAEMLDALKKAGRLDDALVIITADHGEEFFEHGRKGHNKSLYDEVVRVPLIVRWSGRFKAGLKVSDQVRLVDLMPTILANAGIPLNHQVAGRDITPLLKGEAMPLQEALCELLIDKNDVRGLRSNTAKVTGRPSTNDWVYHNLSTDAEELKPAPAMTGVIEAAIKRLGVELQAAAALKAGLNLGDCKVQLPAGMQNTLGGMGYLSTGEDDDEEKKNQPVSPEPLPEQREAPPP